MNKKNIKVILLSPKSEMESAEKLGFDTQNGIFGFSENFHDTIFIRWGYGYSNHDKNGKPAEFKHYITNYRNIQVNCNKLESSRKLIKVVCTPKVYTNSVPKGKLVVIRPLAHARGEDFQVKKGPLKLKEGFYAADFIKCNKEIRAFYCNGKVMVVTRVSQNPERLNQKFKCRSMWGYSKPWKKVPKTLERQVLKAAKYLGFQYGAFDILFKDNKWIFLENNTAPSIDSNFVLNFYKDGLNQIVAKKVKLVEKCLKRNPVINNTFRIVNFVDKNKYTKNININTIGNNGFSPFRQIFTTW